MARIFHENESSSHGSSSGSDANDDSDSDSNGASCHSYHPQDDSETTNARRDKGKGKARMASPIGNPLGLTLGDIFPLPEFLHSTKTKVRYVPVAISFPDACSVCDGHDQTLERVFSGREDNRDVAMDQGPGHPLSMLD